MASLLLILTCVAGEGDPFTLHIVVLPHLGGLRHGVDEDVHVGQPAMHAGVGRWRQQRVDERHPGRLEGVLVTLWRRDAYQVKIQYM